MNAVAIWLLGPMQVTVDGLAVADFEADSARALLAYLTSQRKAPSPRELLAGLLWPESPESEAKRNLRSALYRLRLSIGDHKADPPFLKISRDALQLNADGDYWLDVETFKRLLTFTHAHSHDEVESCPTCIAKLTEAVELYRGDFMLGFSYNSAAFEDWLVVERETLRLEAMEAMEHLASHYDQIGDYARALAYARRQVELEPWRESAHRQWMRALALSGQRAGAIAQYEACRRILNEELGLEPEPATEALYADIRNGALDAARIERAEWPQSAVQPVATASDSAPATQVPPPAFKLGPTSFTPNLGSLGERHFVTVLVAGIEGASDLLAYTDLQSWAAELVQILVFLEAEGRRFGGTLDHRGHQHIALYFGTGATPQQDAEQAVLAAMAMRVALATQLAGASGSATSSGGEGDIRLRIGVSTGEATIVGSTQVFPPDTTPMADEPTGQWAATLVAERVLEGTPAGPIWVDDRTYRLVAPRFEWGAATEIPVKGLGHPARLYTVLAHKETPAEDQVQGHRAPPTSA